MPRDTWWNLPEDKRERILRASMLEFGARGFSAGSLNVIAREAGVAKGSLFQYFDDKLDLFATVCHTASRRIESTVLAGMAAGEEPFFSFLRRLVKIWVGYYMAHPMERGMAFAMANEVDPEARHTVRSVANDHYATQLRPFVEAGRLAGTIRDDVPLADVLSAVIRLLRHLNTAPFDEDGDPWLELHGRSLDDLDPVLTRLVDALERAYGRSS